MKQTSSHLAHELRNKLITLFENETQTYMSRFAAADVPIDADTRADFQYCIDEIDRCVRANLKPGGDVTLPNSDIVRRLHAPLAFKPFVTYDSWHLAENVSDEDLVASKKAILKGDLSALEKFRDPSRQTDFVMPLDENYHRYMLLLGNLVYLLTLLARLSKHHDAPEAGRTFLFAAHLVSNHKTQRAPHFNEEDLAQFEDLFDKGLFELRMTVEYDGLEPWDEFRARAEEELAKTDARAADAQAKGMCVK